MRLVLLGVAALSFCFVGHGHAAEIFGVWAAPSYEAHIEIERCGQALCGKLIGSTGLKANPALADTKNHDPALRDRPLMGALILTGFRGGPEKWQGGKIYNPQDGNVFAASLELTSANSLTLKACLIAPFCQSQVWARVR